jgi:hypothetical protein
MLTKHVHTVIVGLLHPSMSCICCSLTLASDQYSICRKSIQKSFNRMTGESTQRVHFGGKTWFYLGSIFTFPCVPLLQHQGLVLAVYRPVMTACAIIVTALLATHSMDTFCEHRSQTCHLEWSLWLPFFVIEHICCCSSCRSQSFFRHLCGTMQRQDSKCNGLSFCSRQPHATDHPSNYDSRSVIGCNLQHIPSGNLQPN